MFQTLKALTEIITTSFDTKSLRCTRAAFWLCVLAMFVLGIVVVSVGIMAVVFIPTLVRVFILITYLYLCPASIWLTVLTARRIRDVGYRALYFYVYAIITGILGFLNQFGDLNLDEFNELLLTLLAIVILIVHIWILLLCVKPTSPVAEKRFGAAIVYSFDMEKFLLDLKKFVALGIVASAIVGVIILVGILGKEAFIDKKDGCYLSAGNTNRYLGKLKNEFNKDVMKNFMLHFTPKEPNIPAYSPLSPKLAQPQYLAPIDFTKFIPDTLDKTQEMQLQCYEDNRQYLSLKLKDFLVDGIVTLDTDYLSDKPHEKLLVNFERGKIKDSKITLGYNGFQEQRFYNDGVISKIIYTPSPNEKNWEAFEANYENGKLHGEVEILTKKGRLIVPYEYGLLYGVSRLYDSKNALQKQCFVFRSGCSSRIEHHSKNGKTHSIYYDRENNPISKEQVEKKSLSMDVVLNFEDSVLQSAYDSSYRNEADVILFEKGQALLFISSNETIFFYPNGVERFLWSDISRKGHVNELAYNTETCEPSILQSYYNAFMTPPLDTIQSVQINDRILYVPKTRIELLALVRNENINLADIDTKNITDMRRLFSSYCMNGNKSTAQLLIDNFTAGKRQDFSGIESWDTSSVINMEKMFENAVGFNQNINSWNVSKVENMDYMFWNAKSFNQNLDSWDTSKVKNMRGMFRASPLENNPPKWYKE